jgi:hypothetical protein
MTAAAIFENGATLTVLLFSNSACFFSRSIKFNPNRALNVKLTRLIGFFSLMDAKIGVIKLLLGA